ncbi:MAG TPA: antibiotic biosynthesis monooxygenase [Stellaceae bacterium]|nr:antibiotic biosynthesis monooxygenase [Stellaceae bacterium]
MKLSHLVLGLVPLALAALPSTAAQAAGSGLVYTVTYFEAAAPDVAHAAALAREFAAGARKEAGNAGFDAFQEIGRPSRFAMLEAWHDKAAADAHNATASAAAFRDMLRSMLVGPFEIRSFSGFSIAAPGAPGGSQAVYVVTHVDVFPAGKDQAGALVTALAEAGRKMPGNLRFDVLQVDGHANHFTLIEGWRDRKAFDASLMAAQTRDFRQKLTPLEGALYDERLYHALRP